MKRFVIHSVTPRSQEILTKLRLDADRVDILVLQEMNVEMFESVKTELPNWSVFRRSVSTEAPRFI